LRGKTKPSDLGPANDPAKKGGAGFCKGRGGGGVEGKKNPPKLHWRSRRKTASGENGYGGPTRVGRGTNRKGEKKK